MKVIVTGGGGYVGYHVGWCVAQGGHEVILVDLGPPDPEWNTTAPKVLFDALPEGFWDNEVKGSGNLQYVKANITCYSSLRHIFQGATAVIHTASYGISGREQLSAHMTQQEEVNVKGTKTVIMAATAAKVRALVYTSTYNVVFGGQVVRDGDESLSVFPLHAQSDHYSRTKTIAEMLVLMANGKNLDIEESLPFSYQSLTTTSLPLSSLSPSASQPSMHEDPCPSPSPSSSETDNQLQGRSLTLRTCALRLAGVMGLGERRHSCRVIDALTSGFLCTYGGKENLVDFVGIQNVVQAHVKAMMALINEQDNNIPIKTEAKSACLQEDESSISSEDLTSENLEKPPSGESDTPVRVSGNAFFICDGSPENHFEYFRPWYEGLGYGFPTVRLPMALIMVVAHLQQILYLVVHKVFPFKPFITPAEVYKSAVTHFFSCAKAKRHFGYRPTRPNDQSQMVEYYRSRGFTKDANETSNTRMLFVLAILGLVISYVFYFLLG